MKNKIYLNARYGFREDTLENWEAHNPVLERGEPAVVRDGNDSEWLKIGDGVTPFKDLPWKKGPKGDKGDIAGAGERTDGGEIFNDYKNNKAGLKGFNIQPAGVTQADTEVNIPLDSVEGIEVGDVVSVQISNNYDYIGTVAAVSSESLTVTVTLLDPITLPTGKAGTLWLPYKPQCGTTVLGEYAFAANINTTAAAKGSASFGEANVAGGKRSFCAGGEENFAGYADFVAGQGNKIRGLRCAGFGRENEIATNVEYGFVGGYDNLVRSNGTFIIGSGNTEGENGVVGRNFVAGRGNTVKDGAQGSLFLVGNNNSLKGDATVCGGISNDVEASASIVNGTTNTVKGSRHLVAGCHDNVVSGENNTVVGSTSNVSGNHNFVAGWQHNVGGEKQAYFGYLSERDDNAIIVAGNGYFKENVGFIRQNAFKVMKDGSARIQTASTEPDAVVRYDTLQSVLNEAKAYTDNEIATFDFIKVVSALPEAGLSNKIYLVPSSVTGEQDLFDEYIWVNSAWEFVASKKVEVDLTEYVKRDELSADIADFRKEILLAAYPIGSYYWSSTATDPAELFGGIWQRVKDRFILAAGDNYTAGSTGGEAEHTLTVAEMPEHAHFQKALYNPNNAVGSYTGLPPTSSSNPTGSDSAIWDSVSTTFTGGSSAHNNMPPYEVAYCFKRIG